jgi:hypothetical protein
MTSTENHIETKTAHIVRNSNGIIVVRKKPDAFIELEHAVENCAIHRRLANNEPTPCMIIMEEMQNTSPEALAFYSQPEHEEYRSAEAFLIEQLGVRLIVDHYIKNSQMSYPRSTFATEAEALIWLSTYL